NGSVRRVARPPVAGRVQMLPCKSIASVWPSGETATAIEGPSWATTSMGADAVGTPAGAVWALARGVGQPAYVATPSAATTLTNASRDGLQRIGVLRLCSVGEPTTGRRQHPVQGLLNVSQCGAPANP